MSTPVAGSSAVSTPLFNSDAFSTPDFWAAGGGGGGDAFEAAVLAEATLYGFWSCRDVPVAGIANLGTVMTDISGNGRPDIEARFDANNNWEVQTGSGAPGSVASLANYVATVVANKQGTTNYAALASTISPLSGIYDSSSGFVIYYMPSFWQRFELVQYQGTAAAPTGSAGPMLLHAYTQTWPPPTQAGMWASHSDGGTNFNFGTSGFSTAAATDQVGHWVFWGWRNVGNGSSAVTASYSYLQKIGSSWGVDQSPFSAVPPTMSSNLRDGLRMAYGSTSGSVVLNTAWAAHGIFSSDIGESGLRTIYEAIS